MKVRVQLFNSLGCLINEETAELLPHDFNDDCVVDRAQRYAQEFAAMMEPGDLIKMDQI